MGKEYRLEDDLLKKTRPKHGSKRWQRLDHASGCARNVWCEICGKHLFNPLSILIHQGSVCQGKMSNQLKFKNMNFGQALEALKEGKLVQRSGWNGKGMFIFMRPEDTLTTGIIGKVKSLPQSAKDWIENNVDDKTNPGESGLTPVKFTAYLCMKAADNTIVNGWLASQTDMLAEDWSIL